MGSTQIGAQFTHAASKPLPQQCSQGRSIDVADFRRDSVQGPIASMDERARMLNA
jgi:hypothetical protein